MGTAEGASQEVQCLRQRIRALERDNQALSEQVQEFACRGAADFQSLVAHSPDYIARIDSSGRILFINRGVGDCNANEMRGSTIFEFSARSEASQLTAALQRVFKHSESQRLESQSPESVQPPTVCILRISPIPDAVGVREAIFVATDITARRRSEEREACLRNRIGQIRKLESLGRLAGGIAHDFNNLLMGVMGYSSLLLRDPPAQPAKLKALQGIETSAQRAAELCRQLLAYSGRGRFSVSSVDLSKLVRRSARLLRVSVPPYIQLVYRLESLPSGVAVDVVQIRQIVMNLLFNAADAIGDNAGVIVVRTGSTQKLPSTDTEWHFPWADYSGPYAFLEVSDNGCGMTPEARSRIFEPFFTTKKSGRGLGLAAVLGIVRGHRGGVTISSRPGAGSTIRIFLPFTKRPIESLEPEVPPLVEGNEGIGRLLVIDDEQVVREVASQVLGGGGFRVHAAANGHDGIEILQRFPDIRLVLLDLTMPEMSGEETLHALRRINPDVPIVLSSGYVDAGSPRRLASAFLQKPYTAENLLQVVQAVLREVQPNA